MPVRGENSLFYDIGFNTDNLAKGASSSVSIISNMASAIAKINPFAALLTGATIVFAGIANEAYKFAKEYEAAMLEVKTISAETRRDFAGIGGAIFDLSKKTLDDPIKLANAYYQVVSAGYDGAEGLRLLETASKAAVAGVTDTQTAADGITTVLNAFGLAAENADRVADAMFKTVELGKTNFEQLSTTLSTAAPLAASLGVGFEEVLAAAASLTKQGVPTAQAMTQIRSALVSVNDVLGDGWSEMYTFQEAVDAVYDSANGSNAVLKEMLGRIEAVTAVLALAGGNAEGAAADLRSVSSAAGAADKAFKSMAGGVNNSLTILKNRVRTLTEELGQGVLSVADSIASFFIDASTAGNFAAATYDRQRDRLNELKLELQDTLLPQERRVEIIEELQSKYPAFLANIDAETAGYEELLSPLTLINEQLLKKARFERNKDEIAEADEAATNAANRRAEAIKNLQAEIDRLRNENENFAKAVSARGEASFLERYQEVVAAASGNQTLNRLVAGVEIFKKEIAEAEAERIKNIKEVNKLLGIQQDLSKGIVSFAEPGTEGAPGLDDQLQQNEETYTEFINRIKALYTDYETAATLLGQEEADKRFAVLKAYGDNYRQFLLLQLAATKDFEEQRVIFAQLASSKIIDQIKKEREKVDAQSILDDSVLDVRNIDQQTAKVKIEFQTDRKSLNELREELNRVNEALGETTDELNERQLKDLRDNLQQQIAERTASTTEQADEYQKMVERIIGFSLKELQERVRVNRAALKEAKKAYGEQSDEYLKALANLRDSEDKLADEFQDITSQISGMFNSLAGAFDAFGAEDLAELSNQLAGVATGIGNVAAGFASNNPLQVIQGLADVVSSAITVEIVSDTAKFEKQIKALERTVKQLDDILERSIGEDRIKTREDLIQKQLDLERAAKDAVEAERKARKEIKLLGFTVGRKGQGSGTDPEKVKELQDQAREAALAVQDLKAEIDELFTGTTSANITQGILDGFKEGKRGAEDFAADFEDLMRQAIFESLKLKYLEKAVQGFFEDFADAAESDDSLSTREIENLRNQFNRIINRTEQELSVLEQILEDTGISLEDRAAQGLTGGIQTITEDTANVLAGTLNKIMLDTAEGTDILARSSQYLRRMVTSLDTLVELNETAVVRLRNIEDALA